MSSILYFIRMMMSKILKLQSTITFIASLAISNRNYELARISEYVFSVH